MSEATPADSSGADAPRGPVVVLVGPPGSGKTTAGEALARRLGVTFRDTDRDIEDATGSSISDLFVRDGEAHFRELEVAAVERALGDHDGVLALGAGAVLDATTRDRLARRQVVYLRVGLAAAMQRLEMNRSRPLLLGNVRSRWQELAAQREPLYEQLAVLSVDTDRRSPEEVAEVIAAAVAEARSEGP